MPAYVGSFHSRLVGLTGTSEQIAAITKVFGVYYREVKGSDLKTCSVDHSAYSFLVGDHGNVLKIFGHSASADEMAAEIRTSLH